MFGTRWARIEIAYIEPLKNMFLSTGLMTQIHSNPCAMNYMLGSTQSIVASVLVQDARRLDNWQELSACCSLTTKIGTLELVRYAIMIYHDNQLLVFVSLGSQIVVEIKRRVISINPEAQSAMPPRWYGPSRVEL